MPLTRGDLDGDAHVALPDYLAFANCLGAPPASLECSCADMNGTGDIDLHDFALFAVLFGQSSDETPPGCTGLPGVAAELTAYRPQHGLGYAPFARTPVADGVEEDPVSGPGIRINALTFWVEWAGPVPGLATLEVEPLSVVVPKDRLVFHTFRSIVIALGGEDQTPSDPPNSNMGTFVVAADLYRRGYDVHMFDEDHVPVDGAGPVFDEVATAIQHRGVNEVAIFGYSHGGGPTYSLANLLDLSRPALGVFEIRFTSYVDSVRNNSDVDVAQELRRPPGAGYHLNHYQRGVFWEDFGLDGGPVPNSNPPPSGLDVETTPWGAGATHFEVDDLAEVRNAIAAALESLVIRMQEFESTYVPGPASARRLVCGRGPFVAMMLPLMLLATRWSGKLRRRSRCSGSSRGRERTPRSAGRPPRRRDLRPALFRALGRSPRRSHAAGSRGRYSSGACSSCVDGVSARAGRSCGTRSWSS